MKKEIVISHKVIPPTILKITDWGYAIRFGQYEIPLGHDDADRLVKAIKKHETELNIVSELMSAFKAGEICANDRQNNLTPVDSDEWYKSYLTPQPCKTK